MAESIHAESWDDRIARENREEAASIAAFTVKLGEVAGLLSGWTFDPERDNASSFQHAASGAKFYVTMPNKYGRDQKGEAWATWPKSQKGSHQGADDWGLVKYGESGNYRIGFSFSKSAKALASDLRRRLIPQLLEAMIIVNAKRIDQDLALGRIDKDVATLCAAFGTEDVQERSYYAAKIRTGWTRETRANSWHATLKLSNHRSDDRAGQSVDLELQYLTVEQACAIAKLLG